MKKIRSLQQFSGVPKGTTGVMEKDDNDLWRVTWDLERSKPLVDWFNEWEVKKYLEGIP